jgi:hypothetical protein
MDRHRGYAPRSRLASSAYCMTVIAAVFATAALLDERLPAGAGIAAVLIPAAGCTSVALHRAQRVLAASWVGTYGRALLVAVHVGGAAAVAAYVADELLSLSVDVVPAAALAAGLSGLGSAALTLGLRLVAVQRQRAGPVVFAPGGAPGS